MSRPERPAKHTRHMVVGYGETAAAVEEYYYYAQQADRYMDALEAENAELHQLVDDAEPLLNAGGEWAEYWKGEYDGAKTRLTEAVELLRDMVSVGHLDYWGICDRIHAFLSEHDSGVVGNYHAQNEEENDD